MKKHIFISELREQYSLDTSVIEEIICFILWVSRKDLYLLDEINDSKKEMIESKVQKYAHGYPLAYIVKNKTFFGLDFFVNDAVLIPRDDTELLVQKTIETIEELQEAAYYFDIGTGSGCIPVSVFSQVQEKIKKVFLFEISEKALEVAKINVERLTPSPKYNFFCQDFHIFAHTFQNLEILKNTQIVITANLPYIKIHDIYLDKNVLDYEPTLALFWWRETWFELYEDFFKIILDLKTIGKLEKVTLLAEIGYDQFEVAREFFDQKWLKLEIFRDTGYHDRVIKIKL